jgi:hypothetical protein
VIRRVLTWLTVAALAAFVCYEPDRAVVNAEKVGGAIVDVFGAAAGLVSRIAGRVESVDPKPVPKPS